MDINRIDAPTLPVQNKEKVSSPHDLSSEEKKIKKATQAFESFFIAMLFEKMQKTTGENSMFGKGTSGEVYKQMFNQAIGDKMAAQNSFGLSKMMSQHLQNKQILFNPENSLPTVEQNLLSPKLLDTTDR